MTLFYIVYCIGTMRLDFHKVPFKCNTKVTSTKAIWATTRNKPSYIPRSFTLSFISDRCGSKYNFMKAEKQALFSNATAHNFCFAHECTFARQSTYVPEQCEINSNLFYKYFNQSHTISALKSFNCRALLLFFSELVFYFVFHLGLQKLNVN